VSAAGNPPVFHRDVLLVCLSGAQRRDRRAAVTRQNGTVQCDSLI
jgi:hypothetical protein